MLFCLFFSARGGQNAGPILTSYIYQNACFWGVAFLWGLEQQCHNFRGQNPKKPPKIGTNRHFPAKIRKSYNGHISKTASPIKLKFEVQQGTTKCLIKRTKLVKRGRGLGHVTYFSNFGTPLIYPEWLRHKRQILHTD